MRISDWSSDVCSSDLKDKAIALAQQGAEVVASRARANVELRFLAIASHSMVDIAKGENRGRRIGYTNVVLAEQLAPCDPSLACRAPIPAGIAGRKGADRWAAILQDRDGGTVRAVRSEEHMSELQSLMRISYAVFC